MGLFEQRYISSSDSKKENLTKTSIDKRIGLSKFKQEFFNKDSFYDADDFKGQRVTYENGQDKTFDAFEIDRYGLNPNTERGRKKFDKQAISAAALLGKEAGDVTRKDIFTLGKQAKNQAYLEAMQGYVNVPPAGMLDIDQTSLFEGPMAPVINVRQHGVEQDTGDRKFIETQNAYTGRNLLDVMNRPDINAAYATRFNKAKLIEDKENRRILEEQEKLKRESVAILSDESVDTQLGKITNAVIGGVGMFGEGMTKPFEGTAKAIDNLINNVADMPKEDQDTFISRRAKEEKALDIESAIARLKDEDDSADKRLKMSIYRRDLADTKLTVKERMLDSNVNLRGVFTKTKYEAMAASERIDKQVIEPIQKVGNWFTGLKNKKNIDKVLDKARTENFDNMDKQIEAGDYTGAVGSALSGTATILGDPETVAGAVIDSFGFVAANAASFGTAPYGRAVTLTDASYDEFVKKHDRNPTDNEQIGMYALNLASSLIDSSAGKYITTPRKKFATDLETTFKKKIVGNTVDVLKRGGVEYSQEFVQQILEDQASTQDLTKIEYGKAAEGGALGFAGGTGSGAVANVKGAITGSGTLAKKGTKATIKKVQEKTKGYIEGKADKVIVDPKAEGYNAQDAFDVTIKKGTRDTDTTTFRENLKEHGTKVITELKQNIKDIATKLETTSKGDPNLIIERDKLVLKEKETAAEIKKQLQLIKNQEVNDSIKAVIVDPKNASTEDIQATTSSIKTSDRFGNEELDNIITNEDMPEAIVETAKLRKSFNESEKNLNDMVARVKAKDKIRAEILTNTEKNAAGKYSVMGYRNAFKEAIASGNKVEAVKLFKDMKNFAGLQQKKIDGLKALEVNDPPFVFPGSKSSFKLMDNPASTRGRDALVKDVEAEVDYMNKYLSLMGKKGKETFTEATKISIQEEVLDIDLVQKDQSVEDLLANMDIPTQEAPIEPTEVVSPEVDTNVTTDTPNEPPAPTQKGIESTVLPEVTSRVEYHEKNIDNKIVEGQLSADTVQALKDTLNIDVSKGKLTEEQIAPLVKKINDSQESKPSEPVKESAPKKVEPTTATEEVSRDLKWVNASIDRLKPGIPDDNKKSEKAALGILKEGIAKGTIPKEQEKVVLDKIQKIRETLDDKIIAAIAGETDIKVETVDDLIKLTQNRMKELLSLKEC